MQRRQRGESLEPRDNAVIDQDGLVIVWTAVHDTMADRDGINTKLVAQPFTGDPDRCCNVRDGLDRIGALRQRIAVRAARPQSRPAADAIDLPLDMPSQPALTLDREDLELDA